MSSPGPAEKVPTPSKNKTKEKSKKKSKSQPIVVTDGGKNEGQDPHWAYKPPPGAELFDHTFEDEKFDWDAVKMDDDIEIWLIRFPDSIKLKNLDGLEIDVPSSSRSGQVGSLSRKGTVYDIWSMGDGDAEFAGAEELRGLSCLLPRRKKSGKLHMAPRDIARHLVVSAQPSKAIPLEDQSILHQSSSRVSYPKELLKHHFVPYGARTKPPINPDRAGMDTDGLAAGSTLGNEITGSPQTVKESKVKGSKSKKRKSEKEVVHKILKKSKITES